MRFNQFKSRVSSNPLHCITSVAYRLIKRTLERVYSLEMWNGINTVYSRYCFAIHRRL